MRRKPIQHHTDALAALLLFGIFAVCVLAVLLTGADAYRRLVDRDREVTDRRSCSQYLATRVRQSDRDNSVRVEDFEGCDALVLDAESDYPTWLYCHDGWLMELYCRADERQSPGDGTRLVQLEAMRLSLEDGLLTVELTNADGARDSLILSLRSGEGGAA